MMMDEDYKNQLKLFVEVGMTIAKEAEIDIGQTPYIMQLLSNLEKPLIRFIGALSIKTIFSRKIEN